MASPLIDSSGRHIRKLRVSLLDACNYRCFYCMPLNAEFMPAKKWLSPTEIEGICQTLVDQGIEQIRITGGEPTLRKDFIEIVERLSVLPVKKLGLTTNGFFLEKHLGALQKTNCRHINISLDSLQREKFDQIVRTPSFEKTMSSLLRAQEMGFQIKINTVLIKGCNDDELMDFVQFSSERGIEVRFLELMKIGQACQNQEGRFLSASDAIQRIGQFEKLTPKNVEFDSTSFNFITESGAQIGFIASESRPFCGSCSRLRLTADGWLRACLMSEKGLKIKGAPVEEYRPLVEKVMGMKPHGRIESIHQDMYQIGG